MLSNNGSDFSRWENAGDKKDGGVFDTVPDLLGYLLTDIEFYENDNELIDEMDDSGLIARIGNNIYEIIGFVGDKGECGKATDLDTITKPTSQLCNKGLESDVKAILNGNKFYWSRTCYGTTNASCETGIPTAVFDWCNNTSYNNMVVKYSLYNNNFDGSTNFDSNGVVIGDSRVEATLGSSNPQTIYSTNITEINSITYGSNKLPGWSDTYIKDGYAMLAGNYNSSLCTTASSEPKCGTTVNGKTLSEAPSTSERCDYGQQTNFTTTSTGWTWKCSVGAGIPASCYANKGSTSGGEDNGKYYLESHLDYTSVSQNVLITLWVYKESGTLKTPSPKDPFYLTLHYQVGTSYKTQTLTLIPNTTQQVAIQGITPAERNMLGNYPYSIYLEFTNTSGVGCTRNGSNPDLTVCKDGDNTFTLRNCKQTTCFSNT